MALYRKKPVVIEAEQWFPGTVVNGVIIRSLSDQTGVIETLEGNMKVNPGDWIITGVKGERYPCKPDIFAETYEEA
jgi:hypothetical protein